MTRRTKEELQARISSMRRILSEIDEQIIDEEPDKSGRIEYQLNRLRIAIYNFKRIQLPKIKIHENSPHSTGKHPAPKQ